MDRRLGLEYDYLVDDGNKDVGKSCEEMFQELKVMLLDIFVTLSDLLVFISLVL